MILSFAELLNIGRHGVGLQVSNDYGQSQGQQPLDNAKLESLAGRGVDEFIAEHRTTEILERRRYLDKFLEAFLPVQTPKCRLERDIRFATVESFRDAGMVQRIFEGSNDLLCVPGGTIPDIPLDLINLGSCYISWDQTVITSNNDALVDTRHMYANWIMKCIDEGNITDLNLVERTARLRIVTSNIFLPDDKIYFLFHTFLGNTSFGHFMIDVMGQLAAYDRLKATYGHSLTPILAKDSPFILKWPGMTWLFESFFSKQADVVFLQEGSQVSVRRAFTTTQPVLGGNGGICVKAIKFLHDRIHSTIIPTPGMIHPRLVYMSRGTSGREVTNIAAVEDLLATSGFTTVSVEDLTPQGAFDALYGAEVIVGMHGSNLMYQFYTKEPATVIEIAHTDLTWRVLLACAEIIGHTPILVENVGTNADLNCLKATLAALRSKKASA